MKLKKMVAVGLLMAMTLSLGACGGKVESASGEVAENEVEVSKAKEDISLTFAVNVVGEKATALEEASKDFEEKTGYKIDFQAPGASYEELMKTKMAANELPDIFTTHGWSVARYSDYLMPINDQPWAKDISDQIKPVITNKDGDMFVLPIDMDVAGIICNMDVLDEANVNPDDIKTWDDFAVAAEAIKGIGKNPLHIGGKDNWTIGQIFDWVAPSYYVTDESNSQAEDLKQGIFNADTWEEVGGLLDTWNQAGYLNSDVLTANYDLDMRSLAEGNTAFVFYGNASIIDAKQINPDARLGMIPIPSVSADDEPSLIAGEDIAIGVWKDSEVKDAALEFLSYLAEPEVAKKIAEAAGNKSGLTTVTAEIGEIDEYYAKYDHIETFPYFDREYLPSGMWDVMCATGAEILAKKDGAVESGAKIMEQNFNDKFVD